MCLAIPGKVLEIDASGPLKMSKVDFGGIKKSVCVEWIEDVKVGEYVIVHVGCAISKMDEQEALTTLTSCNKWETLKSNSARTKDPGKEYSHAFYRRVQRPGSRATIRRTDQADHDA